MGVTERKTRTAANTEDRRDCIRVVGAREHNLKDVSLSVPKDRITAFVGVSGSGKSSHVFDTVAVEAQRQLNATFPAFIQNQLPKHERPHVDAIENLTTPVVVDQKPLTGNARSTVGTITDISPMMRVLFARIGEPNGGLHMSDTDMLLDLLNGMVDRGNTVVVIEHNLAVIEQAHWIIDLGPGDGNRGGEIVFTGTPEKLVGAKGSLTGEYLRRYRSARVAPK